MKIRNYSELEKFYAGTHPIKQESPDVRFINAVCSVDEVRVYCYYTMVKDMTPYRAPLFTSAHHEMGDPGLLTGAVREYYEELHHCPAVDVSRKPS